MLFFPTNAVHGGGDSHLEMKVGGMRLVMTGGAATLEETLRLLALPQRRVVISLVLDPISLLESMDGQFQILNLIL